MKYSLFIVLNLLFLNLSSQSIQVEAEVLGTKSLVLKNLEGPNDRYGEKGIFNLGFGIQGNYFLS